MTAGFIKDISGNVATTDAKANAAITYSDTTGLTVSSFTSTTADGSYGGQCDQHHGDDVGGCCCGV